MARRILIATSGDYHGLARVSGVLYASGCAVHLLCRREWRIARTRYVSRVIEADGGPAQVAESLRAHLHRHGGDYAWVVVGDDALLEALLARRDEGWLDGWFPIDPHGPAPDIVFSKARFMRSADQAGVPVPPWAVVNTPGDALAAAERIGYPVVLKKELSQAGDGVARADCRAQLLDAWRSIIGRGQTVLQKFLTGRVGVTEALFDHGRPTCWFSSYMWQVWPEPFGPSCARQVVDHPRIEAILRQIGTLTGLHGFGGFDFIHDPATGDLRAIELHARPTPGIHLGRFGSVDFAPAVRDMLAGRRQLQRPRPINTGPVIRMFPQALQCVIEQRDLGGLVRLAFTPGAWRDVPWGDPTLLGTCVWGLAKNVARWALHRRARALSTPVVSTRHPPALPLPDPAN